MTDDTSGGVPGHGPAPMTAAAGGAGAVLPEPWRLPFELAWQSLRADSRPVGAALLDPEGTVVAAGRNRSREATAPAGQLAGTDLAHAEINALARLPAGRRHPGHRLYTTLEPCLLCSGALIHAHVPHVVYAAADDRWRGVERVPEAGGAIAARWARREGPLTGPLRPLARFSRFLLDVWAVRHTPDRVPDGPAAREARRRLAAGLLDAPDAEAACNLFLAPS
ncbi:nucleoside deaminase [Streptomyces sp. NPDC038707]|uniref:nucleoside deaminase n=1 Tax=Streptomyces sp. NPDC038707 TaxID=3154329 RepID=UPI003410AC8B